MHHRLVPVEVAPAQSSPANHRSAPSSIPPAHDLRVESRPSEIHAAADPPLILPARRASEGEKARASQTLGRKTSAKQRGEDRTNVEEPLVSALGGKKTATLSPPQETSHTLQFSHSSLYGGQRNVLCCEQSAEGLGHRKFLMSEAFFSCFGPDSCGLPSCRTTHREMTTLVAKGKQTTQCFFSFFWGVQILQMCLLPENKERRASALYSSERFA